MIIKEILQGYANIITDNYDKEEQHRRLSLCKQCKVYNKVLRNCDYFGNIKGCGCVVSVKATLANASCPYNVWINGHTSKTLKE